MPPAPSDCHAALCIAASSATNCKPKPQAPSRKPTGIILPMWRRLRLDQQVFLLAIGAGGPGAITALWILWTEPYTPKVQWTLTVLILTVLFGLAGSVRTRVVVPLQTLAN